MRCTRCTSENIVKSGFKKLKKYKVQKYKCKLCGREFTGQERYHRLVKEKIKFILKNAHEIGLRKTARLLKIHLGTVQYHRQKELKFNGISNEENT